MEQTSTITIASLASVIALGLLRMMFSQKFRLSFRGQIGSPTASIDEPVNSRGRSRAEPEP